jgi:hypothetical protein
MIADMGTGLFIQVPADLDGIHALRVVPAGPSS